MKPAILKLYFILVIVFFSNFNSHAQNLKLTDRVSNETISLKSKKIKSVVTMDGFFYEGRAKVKADGIIINYTTISYDNIGILEVKKGSAKQVAAFPLKTVGIISGALGLLLTSSYLADEDSEDPAVGVAGLTLLGLGASTAFLGQKVGTESIKSYHVKDWEFSLGQ